MVAVYNLWFIRPQPLQDRSRWRTHSKGFNVFISSAFAQTAAAPAAASDFGQYTQMLIMVGLFAVMYFVLIRPQQKRAKELKAMIDSVGKGDEVITAGGLLGKITKIGESYMSLEVAAGVELQVQRSAVVQVLPKGTVK
jgi:preprotein translocase subunit YajC